MNVYLIIRFYWAGSQQLFIHSVKYNFFICVTSDKSLEFFLLYLQSEVDHRNYSILFLNNTTALLKWKNNEIQTKCKE